MPPHDTFFPNWNTNYYRSCDVLMSISKQTYGINKRLLKEHNYKDWQVQYVPHGVSDIRFFKVPKQNEDFMKFEQTYGLDKYKYRILYISFYICFS